MVSSSFTFNDQDEIVNRLSLLHDDEVFLGTCRGISVSGGTSFLFDLDFVVDIHSEETLKNHL